MHEASQYLIITGCMRPFPLLIPLGASLTVLLSLHRTWTFPWRPRRNRIPRIQPLLKPTAELYAITTRLSGASPRE